MEEQRTTYKQLRPEERMVIASMKLQGAIDCEPRTRPEHVR
jgi:hypothetical protein